MENIILRIGFSDIGSFFLSLNITLFHNMMETFVPAISGIKSICFIINSDTVNHKKLDNIKSRPLVENLKPHSQ